MTINKKDEGNRLQITLEGRLDTTTAPQMEELVRTELSGKKEVVLDLKDLVYISSAGLRIFLQGHKQMMKQGGSFVLMNVTEEVKEILEVTGFIDIFVIR